MKAKNNRAGIQKPKINMTIKEPLRKKIIIPMAKTNTELIINSAYIHTSNVNNCLKNSKSDTIADFIHLTYNGIIITTNKLANPLDLSTIEKYLKNIKNINSDLIKSPCLPKFKLYMKIIGLSYITKNGVITPDFIKRVLKETHLFKDIMLASKPHVIKASPKFDMVVIWVDIWDFQSSYLVRNIINHRFNIGCFVTTIQGTNMNPGILQCKNCWKWGHATLNCHSHVSKYAKYYRAHSTEHHRERAWCCMENKKTNQAATKAGEPCPHTFKYMNCKGDYQVDSISCSYWHNHFNRDWYGRKQ